MQMSNTNIKTDLKAFSKDLEIVASFLYLRTLQTN